MDPLQSSELCLVCFRYHPLRFCKQFKRMTLRQRQYVVRVHCYCTNCFARTHLVGGYISMDGFQVCGELLHPENVLDRLSQPQQQQPLRQQCEQPQQQQPQHQLRQQQQPQCQRRQQQQSEHQPQLQPQRQRRQLQMQPQGQRRQSRQQHRQRRQQNLRQNQQMTEATPNAQGLVRQIVSALDQLTGALNIAPVQGGAILRIDHQMKVTTI